jgi:protein-S-isoprenylcysteine O-methyltransferase Ste14
MPYEAKKTSNLTTGGVYGLIRHPMQAGALILILLGNGVYTTERLLFTAVMVPMVVAGVLM